MTIKTKRHSNEAQRLHYISQLIKQDLTNLKKSKKKEPSTAEVICTPQDIFHSRKKRK